LDKITKGFACGDTVDQIGGRPSTFTRLDKATPEPLDIRVSSLKGR
jgi:hypothetical protein